MTRAGVDLAELRRLAEAATPGPWRDFLDMFDSDPATICACVADGDVKFLAAIETDFADPTGPKDPKWGQAARSQQAATAQYIAAANPATILALLDLLTPDAMAKALDVLSDEGLEYDLMAPEEREERYDVAAQLLAALAASPDPEGPSDD